MNDSTIAEVYELQQIEKIKNLKARYCRFVDTKQWDLLSNLLSDDANLVFEDAEGKQLYEFKSSKEMIDLSARMLAMAVTVHHVHNFELVTISDEEASVIWGLEDQILFPDNVEAPFKSMHGFGHYHETLRKSGEQWKIKSFRLTRLKLDYQN